MIRIFDWNEFQCPVCDIHILFVGHISDGIREYPMSCSECRAKLVVTVNVIARIEKAKTS